jgi:hypothetical protein
MDNAQRLGWLWCELLEIYGLQNKAGIRQYPKLQSPTMSLHDAPDQN